MNPRKKARNRSQMRKDLIKACPNTITRIQSKAGLKYFTAVEIINRLIEEGLIEIKEEDPRLYGINRKTPVKIYHATKKGLTLLGYKHPSLYTGRDVG